MLDSLHTSTESFSGIPDPATRITALVVAGFVIAVIVLLVYLKMKEEDERQGV